MDVIEIDAASNRGIDEVRDLLEKVHFIPVKGKYKVYIIDEAHMLTQEAFNALLKTFEEPPAHVVFILATTEARKVPLTIISRCQRYDFRSISEKILRDALMKIAEAEQVTVEEDALFLLAEKARGSMRDALSLMDQAIGGDRVLTAAEIDRLTGSVSYDFWPGFFRSVAENDLPRVFRAIDEIEAEGKDLRQFFRDFRDRAGDLLSVGEISGGENGSGKILKECASLFTSAQILTIISVCGESEIVFRYNRDAKAVCRFLTARIMKELFPNAERPAPLRKEAESQRKEPETAQSFGNADAAGIKETLSDTAIREEIPLPDEVPPPGDDDFFPDIEETVIPPLNPVDPGKKEIDPLPDLFGKESEAEETGEVDPKPARAEKTERERKDEAAAEKTIDGEQQLLWAKLLQKVKKQDRQTFTWLSAGELREIGDAEIVVAYDGDVSVRLAKVREPSHLAVIETALAEVFGKPMHFRAVAAERQDTSEGTLF